ncbi:bifunctional homocysteine S-methyltransferase/methylenetetrahydrofolate reductase [Pseudonocardia sp.]|uniref:bifunctional homocysteine S-methyltransferase/methylenetetrahydrofolate reductase n=1 Tax=Pseudonocardia sp. TaxID=60912 RepID=UPI00261A9390|nr:bifunctional homocysteine S-methyltransferase/methylenetetrahydrofolate reductase [Pseudonocardia sp.]
MNEFTARLAGSVLVADGAMGTVLHAAGNPLDRALAELNLSNAALVRTVHDSYLDAGAEIVQTNTFGANRLRLAESGLAEQVREINAAGVRVAREAAAGAGRAVFVAGSVSPAVTIRQRRRVPVAQRAATLREQVEVLVGEGVDLVVLETFGYLDELVEAIEVALGTGGVPVIAQATFAADGRMLSGDTAADLCRAVEAWPVAALGTNCTLGPQGVLAVVEQLRAGTALPLSAQPNAGLPRRTVGSRFTYDVEADYFARYARLLADAGAVIVGGCCGTTPAHVRAAADALRERPATRTAPRRPGTAPPRRPLLIGAEIEAPPAGRLAAARDTAIAARDQGATLLALAAGSTARAHLSPVTVAVNLQNELGVETLACVPTWDKTIMALQADLLGAHALGVRRIVCETGRPPLLGDYPHVDGVWDVDSVGLVALLAGLNDGTDYNGLHLAGKTAFDIGARINPGALDVDEELAGARRKIEAGAAFVLTRPVYEPDRLRVLLDGLEEHAPRVLVCVRPLRSFAEAEYLRHEVPDVAVPSATLAALRRAGDAAVAVGAELAAELVAEVAQTAAGVVIALPDGVLADPLFAAAREAAARP